MGEETKRHVVGWFDIPVENLDRAIAFYSEVFGFKLEKKSMGEAGEFASFPNAMTGDLPGCAGSLFKDATGKRAPGNTGVMIYFTSPTGDVANELLKVDGAGGNVIVDKIKIPGGDWGFMGVIEDTEGNYIAVHSQTG